MQLHCKHCLKALEGKGTTDGTANTHREREREKVQLWSCDTLLSESRFSYGSCEVIKSEQTADAES